MTLPVEFDLAWNLQPQPRPRVTRSGTYVPGKAKYQRELALLLPAHIKGALIGEPIAVLIRGAVCTKRGNASRFDVDNVLKGWLDALVAHQVLADDHSRIVRRVDIEFTDIGPKVEPRTWCRIEAYTRPTGPG